MSKSLNVIVLLLVCLSAHAWCTADEPFVSYIFPAGGQRGTTVKFNVGGHNLHKVCPFEMIGPGITPSEELRRAEKTVWFEGPVIPQPASQRKEDYPKDQAGEVVIADNAPLGFRRWRVWTSQGVTPSMKFVVGDLPEIIEEEFDGRPIPVQVTLPVTINGRIFPREDIDIWSVECRAGESYTCEVMAARLGSSLDSRLEVIDPTGQRIAENTDSKGTDSFLRFTAATDGVYQVRIHDINYGGLQHFVYRLTITDGPYIDHFYPLGGRQGETLALTLFGQKTPAGTTSIKLPAQQGVSHGQSFSSQQIEIDGNMTNPVYLDLSDLPEHLESEPNDDATKVNPRQLPAVFNGMIQQPGDVDMWRFEAKKNEQFEFDLRAARLGSHLDSVIAVTNADGKQIAQSDDVASVGTDSLLKFKAPVDGIYTVRVADRFTSRGGPAFAYRLYVKSSAAPEPDFQLRLPADVLTLPRAGEAKLKVTAKRLGGFNEEIELKLEGLPKGITLEKNKIPAKKNDTQLVLKADEKAKLQLVRVKLVGTAKIGESEVTRTAKMPSVSRDETEIDELALSIALPTPFKVTGIFETKYAARGSTYVRHYTIDRGGFAGPITITMADRQVRHLQGVTGPTIVLPPGETEFDYPIKLAPWMVVGRTSRTCVSAIGEVTEPDGSKHKVSYTSHQQNDQVIVLVDPGQLDIQIARKSLFAIPGKSVDVPVRIGRGKNIRSDISVECIIPKHIRGISTEPIHISNGKSEAALRLTFTDSNLGPFNMPLVIRATADVDGKPYTAETSVDILPSE